MLFAAATDKPGSYFHINILSRHVASGYRAGFSRRKITLRRRGETFVHKSRLISTRRKGLGR